MLHVTFEGRCKSTLERKPMKIFKAFFKKHFFNFTLLCITITNEHFIV